MSRPMALETDWDAETLALLEARAARPGTFTADDLREDGASEPDQPNRWGNLFRRARRAGIIIEAGYAPSRRKARHGGSLRVWAGLAATEEAQEAA